MILIQTDARSRVVLPGHANQKFIVQENGDGSLLLQPAIVKSASQDEYDNNPELQELLTRAAASPTVKRRLGAKPSERRAVDRAEA